MSVTSYFEQPLTHRVTNHGPSLFRLIGITNESLGDQSDGASAGFDGTPELTNRWFRGYRLALTTTTPTGRHRHPNPVAIVAVAGSATVDAEGAATRALAQPGAFGYVAANVAHTLRATSPDAQVQEIEIRHPR